MQTIPFAVLSKHWPDVPKWRDIKDVTKDTCGIYQPTLISGGFPCQPFSTSGKRKGKGDARYLWPEMLRVIKELQPTWIVGENVANFIRMELDNAVIDLENTGYEVRAFNIPAVGIGAWHKRERCFIVAHSRHDARSPEQELQPEISEESPSSSTRQIHPRCFIPNTSIERDRCLCIPERRSQQESTDINWGSDTISNPIGFEWSQLRNLSGMGWSMEQIAWFANCIFKSEPGVGRVVDGVSKGLDEFRRQNRCHALGNAVVPQQVYPILKAIADIERGMI